MKHLIMKSIVALCLALALMLAMPLASMAQTGPNSHFGGQFGQIVSNGTQPANLYAGSGTVAFSRMGKVFQAIFGGAFDEAEVTIMWSGGASPAETKELYGARVVGEQDISVWGALYSSIGVGAWLFINTDGPDMAHWALTTQVGYNWSGYDIHIGGDWIAVDGDGWKNDRFWLFAGVLADI